MVHIKTLNKSKYNVVSIVSCLILIVVFFFGCLQYAYAETTDDFVYGENSSKYLDFDNGKMLLVVKLRNEYFSCYYNTFFITPTNKRVALLRVDRGDSFQFYTYLENNSLVESGKVESISSYQEIGKSKIITGFSSSRGLVDDVYLFNGQDLTCFDKSLGEVVEVGCPVFDNMDDINSYLNSGVINNPIYQPTGYNSDIPTPKNLEVYFNRKLESPFNIGDMHSPINIKWEVPEGEDYSDYTLETYIDVNYNKINSLGGIGTKPTVLNTGRVKLYEENASHCQMNISDTCEGWSALSEKFDTSVWGITGNYLDLWIRYVDSGGNYGNWVKVHITPSNSGSVIKFGGTNTTINKGYEEISGDDNTTKVDDSQYGDKYFVSTKDNGFSESVTNLKSQFGDLISFFSSLFSFLPKEVWELLVAFIGAGCLVALFKFIRG